MDDNSVVEIIKQAMNGSTSKIVAENNEQNLKYITGTVVGYDEDTYQATVYLEDETDILFTFYNKTGSKLSGGDNVKIQYTVNPAKGDLIVKCGLPVLPKNDSSGGGVGQFANDEKNAEIFNDYVNNKATAEYSHAEGLMTTASGYSSHAEGYNGVSSGFASHVEGGGGKSIGQHSHAEGQSTEAIGGSCHAEGIGAKSDGSASHAEGLYTEAYSYSAAHAEGGWSKANGQFSHAEGRTTEARGDFSHAEGNNTAASSLCSHAEGLYTTASGFYSHAEGGNTEASGDYSHTSGRYTIASQPYSFVLGLYNIDTVENDLFVVGNGIEGARSNAFRVDSLGNAYAATSINSTGADYAELFEWLDGNVNVEDRRGYFVTLDGEKIRKANAGDDYIIGVISSVSSMIGDNYADQWKDMYKRDLWGNVIYAEQEVTRKVPETEEYDEEVEIHEPTPDNPQATKKVMQKRTRMVEKEVTTTELLPVVNPDYDSTKKYTPRLQRPEWAVVGMLGKVIVNDDGTCIVNGYCKVADGGIATKSNAGYRIIARIDENHIKIIFK